MLIYKSYGVLAHEKTPVYTFDGPVSEIFDAVEVSLPEGWSVAHNAVGQTLVDSPDGITYLGREILSNRGYDPVFRWYDGHSDRWIKLRPSAQKNYRVIPEYRDLWSNDPDWDGIVTDDEIRRLAREWGKTVEELMEQVEEV